MTSRKQDRCQQRKSYRPYYFVEFFLNILQPRPCSLQSAGARDRERSVTFFLPTKTYSVFAFVCLQRSGKFYNFLFIVFTLLRLGMRQRSICIAYTSITLLSSLSKVSALFYSLSFQNSKC